MGKQSVASESIPTRVVTATEAEQIFSLNGLWALTGPEQQHWQARVPAPWEHNYPRKLATHFGMGIYQLQIQLPPSAQGKYFKLYTSLVGGEYARCFVNGQLVGQNGFSPRSTSRVLTFSPFIIHDLMLQLRCEVRNTKLHSGGLIRPVIMGPAWLVDRMVLVEKMKFSILIGIFLFLGVFHLLLYAGYRQDKALLWFAIFCLSVGLFGEFYNARIWEFLIGEIPLDISARLTRVALFMMLPSFFWYTFYTAPVAPQRPYLSQRFMYGITWVNVFFFCTLALPTHLHAPLLVSWLVLMLGCVLYNIYRLWRFVTVRGAYPFLISNLIFSLSLLNDLCNGMGVLHTGNVGRYGLLLFCLLQAGFLSWRLQSNYLESLRLQGELTEVNENLEGLVSERTQEVRSKNEELQQLVKFKDDMTQMMVHDLKTPLSTLLNLPTQSVVFSSEQRKSFELASQRILHLVENMLHVKQVEMPELQVQLKPLALEPMTAKVLATIAPWASSKKIRLHSRVTSSHWVLADAALLERVILNVLDNAIKHTPIGGTITVSSRVSQAGIVYQIQDNGSGISPDLLPKVFAQHQSFASQNGKRSTGLGLHFCHQAMEAQQGQIDLSSTLDQGTTVTLSLPSLLEPVVDTEARDVLAPILMQLRQCEVFDVGQIQVVLQPLKGTDNEVLQRWLVALEQAVRSVDEEAYAALITEVTLYSGC